jgi:hypothetical protein
MCRVSCAVSAVSACAVYLDLLGEVGGALAVGRRVGLVPHLHLHTHTHTRSRRSAMLRCVRRACAAGVCGGGGVCVCGVCVALVPRCRRGVP